MNEIKKYKKMHDETYNTEIVDASKIDRKVKQHKVRDKNNNKLRFIHSMQKQMEMEKQRRELIEQ